MQLHYNGKLARFHRWTYGTSPSDNLCPFFWKMLFASLLFPLTWLSHPFECSDLGDRIRGAMVVLISLSAVGCLIGATLAGQYLPIFVVGGIIGIGVAVLLIIAIACGIYFGGLWLFEKSGETIAESETVNEVVSVIRERKNAFKDKFCPRIEWKI